MWLSQFAGFSLSPKSRYSVLFSTIALAFGLVLGFASATVVYRYGLLSLPGEHPLERMARVLQLTPAQFEQIRAIMHETHHKIEDARKNLEQQRNAILFNAYMQTRALLTRNQQTIFDARFVPPSARARMKSAATPTAAVATGTP
jgi:hypothetical protein